MFNRVSAWSKDMTLLKKFLLSIVTITLTSAIVIIGINWFSPIKNYCSNDKDLSNALIGKQINQCDANKNFLERQVNGSTGYSWCTTKDGFIINGTLQSPSEKEKIDCKLRLSKLTLGEKIDITIKRIQIRLSWLFGYTESNKNTHNDLKKIIPIDKNTNPNMYSVYKNNNLMNNIINSIINKPSHERKAILKDNPMISWNIFMYWVDNLNQSGKRKTC